MSKQASRPRGEPPGENSSANDRVIWVVDSFCDGNRAETARLVGFSHTGINKVVAGQRKPGRRLLIAISKKMGISATWLLTGSGTPFDTPTHASIGDGYAVPISRALLPGPPTEYRNQLTGETHMVAGMHSRESLYVLEVQPNDPILDDPSEAIRPGDRILLDTDPGRWRENVRTLNGRLCCIRRKTTAGPDIVLARVYCQFDTPGESCQLYASIGSTSAMDMNTEPHDTQVRYHKPLRPIQTDKPQPERLAVGQDKLRQTVKISDIVSVATVLYRFL